MVEVEKLQHICACPVCSVAHTSGKKPNPGKVAYKLAQGHATEQIGAEEVKSHTGSRDKSRKEILCDNLA